MSAQVAANVLWAVWYLTWIGAVIWSGKTKTQMKTDIAGLHRLISGIGAFMLFTPSAKTQLHPGHSLAQLALQRLWPVSGPRDYGLLFLTAAGFGFCWWARVHLGKMWSGFVTLKEDHRIVDTGPYGLVRHPIYSGVIWAALMTAFIRATPLAFLGAFLLGVGFSITARIEERFLRDQLDAQGYEAYRRRVGMLTPKLR
jgi:protein-S-isoprenylcysteine O-methyltransferase Ste14